MTRATLLLTVFVLTVVVKSAFTADAPLSWINPATQPLLALRAADARLVNAILATRQVRAFDVVERDFSGRLPGVNARVKSLRYLIGTFANLGGRNLWYCLLQDGSSLVKQTGAMGWDMMVGDEIDTPGAINLLAQMGLNIRDLDVDTLHLGSGAARFVVSRDGGARRDMAGGAGRPDAGWRGSFASFLNGPKDSAGAWMNTRPLMGLLSLLSGIDFRSELGARGMGTPAWAQLELFDNQGDLGFEARLDNILPRDIRNSDPSPLLIRNRETPVLHIAVPSPARLGGMLAINRDILLLANIDFSVLVPRSLGANVFRSGREGYAWDLVCLMPDKTHLKTQLARARSWVEALSAGPSSPFAIAETSSRWGDALWRIRAGDISFVLGVVEKGAAGEDGAFVVIASTAEDWPDPRDIKIGRGAAPCLVQWESTLDPEARAEIAAALAGVSRRHDGEEYTADFFEGLLPERDSGRVAIDAGALVLRSEHGLLPFLVPGVADMLRDGMKQKEDPVRIQYESAGRQ